MVMRTDRGWFCLSEINLKRHFSAASMELVKSVAKAAGIINKVSSPEKLKQSAIGAANKLAGKGLDRKTLSTLKHDLYRDICQSLAEPIKFYSLL